MSRRVCFEEKPEVHTMYTWDYAFRQARKGEWEIWSRDRGRFKKRVSSLEDVLFQVLKPEHRGRVYCKLYSDCR